MPNDKNHMTTYVRHFGEHFLEAFGVAFSPPPWLRIGCIWHRVPYRFIKGMLVLAEARIGAQYGVYNMFFPKLA